MFLAFCPKCSVLRVSWKLPWFWVTVQIIAVDEFPHKLFCKILVSLESRKFMNCLDPIESLLITFESASNDLLMFEPSRSLSPSACVLVAPSDPAKSTKFNCDILLTPSLVDSRLILKTVWDRDEKSFNLVSATLRTSSPYCISLSTVWESETSFSESLLIWMPVEIDSRISKFLFCSLIKSLMHSLYSYKRIMTVKDQLHLLRGKRLWLGKCGLCFSQFRWKSPRQIKESSLSRHWECPASCASFQN